MKERERERNQKRAVGACTVVLVLAPAVGAVAVAVAVTPLTVGGLAKWLVAAGALVFVPTLLGGGLQWQRVQLHGLLVDALLRISVTQHNTVRTDQDRMKIKTKSKIKMKKTRERTHLIALGLGVDHLPAFCTTNNTS